MGERVGNLEKRDAVYDQSTSFRHIGTVSTGRDARMVLSSSMRCGTCRH